MGAALMASRPRISHAELDDIKARNPIEGIAAGYTLLRRSGKSLLGACPMCGGKQKSGRFEIFVDQQTWGCYAGCGGGDVISLIQKVENVDFSTAIERLGGRLPVDAKRAEQLAAEHDKKRLAR